jgi:arylsulfatase A-like enzyme
MIVRYPKRFAANVRCDRPATLLDIWPTCLSLAGLTDSSLSSEGLDLADLAASRVERDSVYSQYSSGAKGLYAVMSQTLKYIYSAADDKEWLFDLSLDANETHNFAGNPSYEKRQEKLKRQLIMRFQKDGYFEPLEEDSWRVFLPSRVPEHSDALLLFQDPN